MFWRCTRLVDHELTIGIYEFGRFPPLLDHFDLAERKICYIDFIMHSGDLLDKYALYK